MAEFLFRLADELVHEGLFEGFHEARGEALARAAGFGDLRGDVVQGVAVDAAEIDALLEELVVFIDYGLTDLSGGVIRRSPPVAEVEGRRRGGDEKRREEDAAKESIHGISFLLFGAGVKERFLLREFQHAVHAAFSAEARFFVAAERRGGVAGAVIDIHVPGADLFRDGDGSFLRAVHGGIETVAGVIGEGHGFVFRLVGEDAQHGAEDLVSGDGHVHGAAGEDGRLHIVAADGIARHAAGEEPRSFGQAFFDITPDLPVLGERGEGADFHGMISGIAHGVFFHNGGEARLDLRFFRFRDDEAGEGRAGLAGIEEDGIEAAPDGGIVVVHGEEDIRRLPAQFKGDALYRAERLPGDLDASRGGAGKRDHVDGRMGRHGIAHFRAAAGDHIEYAFRESRPVESVRHEVARERRVLRWLQDDRIPHEECGNDFLHHLAEGIVPRRDAADDAHRLAIDRGEGHLFDHGHFRREVDVRADAGVLVFAVRRFRERPRRAELFDLQVNDLFFLGAENGEESFHEGDAFG